MSRVALLSVSDKEGIEAFAEGLVALGWELLSTGGTASRLADAGLPVTLVESVTGFGEAFGGRLKTLSPRIFGGILARRGTDDDAVRERGLRYVDLVCVNFYPFERAAERGAPRDVLVENVDIGGPSLVRAAAKNARDVLVVVDPDDYGRVLDALKGGAADDELREALALKAFARTASYDAAIYRALCGDAMPRTLPLVLPKLQSLRYGENPHQNAAVYGDAVPWACRHGKALSYNNIVDIEGAWGLAQDLGEDACAIVKHASPCGAAAAGDALSSFERAFECDETSAFGSVVAVNGTVTDTLAEVLNGVFLEVVAARSFSEGAFDLLKAKKNRRLVELSASAAPARLVRSAFDTLLLSEPDTGGEEPFRVVAGDEPDEGALSDLRFAWLVAKWVRSNAVVLARDGATVGVGGGQPSRVGVARVALSNAGERARGAVMASDGFFPFPDVVELASDRGVAAVVHPGGSVRDDEVVAAAERLGVTLLVTGTRHFRH